MMGSPPSGSQGSEAPPTGRLHACCSNASDHYIAGWPQDKTDEPDSLLLGAGPPTSTDYIGRYHNNLFQVGLVRFGKAPNQLGIIRKLSINEMISLLTDNPDHGVA
jgi:hypothetical protein